MRKILTFLMCIVVVLALGGCKNKEKDNYSAISGLDKDKAVTLTIAIPYETNKALNTIANEFTTRYPNVTIQLKYVEDYDTNAVGLFKNNSVDIILQKDVAYTDYTTEDEDTGEKVADGTCTEDYFYNFYEDDEIDFSGTTPDISNNFRHVRVNEDGETVTYQYCYPLGGETRGVFVNVTLLKQYGLSVPSNYTEFIECCKVLKENGYIPIQGGGDTAAYGLGIAPAANRIVHNEAALEDMKNAVSGVSSEFEDTIRKLYDLASNRYFDYKAVEEMGYFATTNELGQVESFLGLKTDPDTLDIIKPENNCGYAAFLPYISSTETIIRDLINEYKLDTEIEFICSPLNDEGTNSPVYITPYYGICINKNSDNLIWEREFVNFIFNSKNNRTYAEEAAIIPNVSDALEYVADKYDVDVDTDVTLCGQIKFSDEYNGFSPIANTLKTVLKSSAQKYMVNLNKDADGNIQYETDEDGREFLYMGNGETVVYKEYVGEEDTVKKGYAFCTLDYYLDFMEGEFAKYRVE